MVKFKYPEFIHVFEEDGRIRVDIGHQETNAPDRVRMLLDKDQALGLKQQLERVIPKVEFHEKRLQEQFGPLNRHELDDLIEKNVHSFEDGM